ncbi:hypothetical protein BDZ91DRAFT_779932 [Kalaharituber pfeilii]|nr:hypothetical protein BDZ91DRAFT_779932 [Kalaharituber pfeilii]
MTWQEQDIATKTWVYVDYLAPVQHFADREHTRGIQTRNIRSDMVDMKIPKIRIGKSCSVPYDEFSYPVRRLLEAYLYGRIRADMGSSCPDIGPSYPIEYGKSYLVDMLMKSHKFPSPQQARNEQEKLNHTAEVIRDSVESVEQGWEEVVEELEETLGEVLAEEEMNPESDSSDWSSNSSSDDSSSSSSESEDDGSSDESEVDAAEEDKWLEEEYDDELDNSHLDSEMTVEEMEDEILKGLIAQWLMRHRYLRLRKIITVTCMTPSTRYVPKTCRI